MAGIYFHVPFCKQACHYCDFHFSTSIKYKDEMLRCMLDEIQLQAHYLPNNIINTIYFGGGTPSLLSPDEINLFMDELSKHFEISDRYELTLEANPDDLDRKKVQLLKKTPINRFSIGIQSFFEEDLRWMNRAHTAEEAKNAIKRVQDAGFENITADLIYGFPLLTDEKWHANIDRLISFAIPHISAYNMTIEPKTALAHQIKKGRQDGMDEEQGARQFLSLMDRLTNVGYDHYEISNFALPQRYAIHNTNYWRAEPYLGIGPSAHSFDGSKRQWNINHNTKYMSAIQKHILPAEMEVLSETNKINEYIMTSLRTMWGLDLNYIDQKYDDIVANLIVQSAAEFINDRKLIIENNCFKLTREGKLMADHIAANLFIDHDD